jgi:hypothetical protein
MHEHWRRNMSYDKQKPQYLKHGTAFKADILVCPDNHIHVIGRGMSGEAEYEIVLGQTLQVIMIEALAKIRLFRE